MLEAIEKRLLEISNNFNSSVELIEFITTKEFERSGVTINKLNYFHYLCNIKISEVLEMLNFYYSTQD